MASKPEDQSSPLDTVKMVFALALLTGGVAGYYYFEDQAFLYRVLGLLAVVLMALGVVFTTAVGQRTWGFLKESRVELRKMVWPSRGETVQTTLAVFVMVLVMGIFLWLLDMLLGWAVQFVIA
ncbi:MAG: preprotein translocase subunit SecE [Gammaproteobacteria bacterium]|nr:preprotein translocase subunit SecE [Gammaproteobacteria bacterium]